jgi:hypothetical protein
MMENRVRRGGFWGMGVGPPDVGWFIPAGYAIMAGDWASVGWRRPSREPQLRGERRWVGIDRLSEERLGHT